MATISDRPGSRPRAVQWRLIAALLGLVSVLALSEFLMRPASGFFDSRPYYLLPSQTNDRLAPIRGIAWSLTHRVSSILERDIWYGPVKVMLFGSSVVMNGFDVREFLASLPPPLRDKTAIHDLSTPGALTTEGYVIGYQALRRTQTDVLVYGIAARDFRKTRLDAILDNPLQRVWNDGSMPNAPGESSAERYLSGWLKRVSRIARYRTLVRHYMLTDLLTAYRELTGGPRLQRAGVDVHRLETDLESDPRRARGLQENDARLFLTRTLQRNPGYITGLQLRGIKVPLAYKNPQLAYLEELLSAYAKADKRVILVAFPVNPLVAGQLLGPEERRQRNELFLRVAALAERYGQVFIDCRDCLEPEYFMDLNHLTFSGEKAFSRKLAELLEPYLRDVTEAQNSV